MPRHDLDSITEALQRKDSEELLYIWESNNRREWREEAYIAIRDILKSRGVDVLEQKPYVSTKADSNEESNGVSFLGEEMCLGCGALVSTLLHTCPDCGCPVSRAFRTGHSTQGSLR